MKLSSITQFRPALSALAILVVAASGMPPMTTLAATDPASTNVDHPSVTRGRIVSPIVADTASSSEIAVSQPMTNGTALLTLVAPSGTITVGQVITVDLLISTSVASRAGQVLLNYDPAILKCVRFTEGDFFKTWADANGAETLVIPTKPCSASTGVFTVTGLSLLGQALGGPSGSGLFGSFVFSTVVTGTAPITLSKQQVQDDGDPSIKLAVTAVNTQVTVGGKTGPTNKPVFLPLVVR